MARAVTAARSRPWARGGGVALRSFDGPLTDGLAQALRDGIERGHEGPLPAPPTGVECFVVRRAREVVGLLAFERHVPEQGAVTIVAVAIALDHRGHGYGARALLAAERRLRREGAGALYARVPRTNGRGLYFMLRAGYAPVRPPGNDGGTWFKRF